ncbi:tyrosine-type recombinase/integrase [Alcaligenes sp.]|uniref:tyrosine-type recombinase/integrase n=1 Tax=Alcaligenes sp. TaxID=512 RepID=UPI003B6EADA4|nr:tyrosine-type recombinase/integrase [Klebsiella pneumoniae]
MALTDMAVRQARASGKPRNLLDGDGLSLFVPVKGRKAWHLRYTFAGRERRISLGTYPEVSLREARELREAARAQLAKGLNPRAERKRKHLAAVIADEHTFMAVYERWRDHRKLSLEEGRQTSLSQIKRVFNKDVFPVLRHLNIHEITSAHLLEIIGRIEKRGSLSVAEKLRTWFRQLFRFAKVAIPGMAENPALDLDAVALPLPPVDHNPFLRMPELPAMLQSLRKYRGRLNTQLAVRLLLLTGVRTGELRYATPDQFDLDNGLWCIPAHRLKQRRQLKRNKRQRLIEIPPYIVPLSIQAQEIVRHLLADFKPAQVYLIPSQQCLKYPFSENTVNQALKRIGYDGMLTGHGLRATLSTALNELGYPKVWVDAQLSHADPNRISATYNHAEYVEQRRVMIQDWADRLDLFEQGMVQLASQPLTVTLRGLPVTAGHAAVDPPAADDCAPVVVVGSDWGTPAVEPKMHRLPAVPGRDGLEPEPSELQRERNELLDMFESPQNLRVVDYARLAGKSRRWISYEIQARNVLALSVGHRGMRVPEWQLEPIKGRLVSSVLTRTSPGIDSWQIYHALRLPHSSLNGLSPIDAVTASNLERVCALVCEAVEASASLWPGSDAFGGEQVTDGARAFSGHSCLSH